MANQTRIYALIPEARSRLNTVYMVTYFLEWARWARRFWRLWLRSRWGWNGVCAAGAVQLLVALVWSRAQAPLNNYRAQAVPRQAQVLNTLQDLKEVAVVVGP